jgi:hypothetical protein
MVGLGGASVVTTEALLVVDATGPVVVDATGPVVVDATGPVVVDATGPVVVDATGTVVVDATGTVVVDATGTVVVGISVGLSIVGMALVEPFSGFVVDTSPTVVVAVMVSGSARESTSILAPLGKTCRSTSSTAAFATYVKLSVAAAHPSTANNLRISPQVSSRFNPNTTRGIPAFRSNLGRHSGN